MSSRFLLLPLFGVLRWGMAHAAGPTRVHACALALFGVVLCGTAHAAAPLADSTQPSGAPFLDDPSVLGPFELRLASQAHALQFDLVTQLRASYSDTQAAPTAPRAADGSVEVRRLRPMLRGSIFNGAAELFLHLNLTPGSLELLDLYAQFTLHPQARLRIGQFKIPYTQYRALAFMQLQASDWSLTSRYLGGERQMGIILHNDYERPVGFTYAVGVFSGVNARRSHGIGMGLLYGEKLQNPSDLVAPAPLGVPHPELALHMGYAQRALHPERTSDPQRGPVRLGGFFSAAYDLRPTPALDFSLRLAAEVQLKVRGLSTHAVGYVAFFNGDGRADLRPAFYGALVQTGYRLTSRWELSLRYAGVFSTAALRADARTRADGLIAAASPTSRDALALQFRAAGMLELDQALDLLIDQYLIGHGLKVQLEGSWLRQQVSGVALDGVRARLQLQIAL